jgi:eukaryotic-like serine/threonine-protein kinase
MTLTTTLYPPFALTQAFDEREPVTRPTELLERYDAILAERRIAWTEHHRFRHVLGSGGQGVVFLGDRRGADGFSLPIAVKVFSPDRYADARAYDDAMMRIARVSARVAQIQQDNLLDVHNFIDRNRIRLMEMEWIDGYDLQRLLTKKTLELTRSKVSDTLYAHITNVIIAPGETQPRFKPGVAIAIVRDCLAALSALHREDIVHGDVKPANLMLKRTGNVKIVDMGSAFDIEKPPLRRTCTPAYAAPEVIERGQHTPQSDLASLGYVLIEMLAGQSPMAGLKTYGELLEAKRFLAQRLESFLPEEVRVNQLLVNFVRGLIAPDPTRRFGSADAADTQQGGAASFHRQLIKSDLASEYDSEIRRWLEWLPDVTSEESLLTGG